MLHLYAGSIYLKSYQDIAEAAEDLTDRDEFYFLGLKLMDDDDQILYENLDLYNFARS